MRDQASAPRRHLGPLADIPASGRKASNHGCMVMAVFSEPVASVSGASNDDRSGAALTERIESLCACRSNRRLVNTLHRRCVRWSPEAHSAVNPTERINQPPESGQCPKQWFARHKFPGHGLRPEP